MEDQERMRRNMEFIVDQQARFERQLAQSRAEYSERAAAFELNMSKLAGALLSLTNIVSQHEERQAKTDEQIAALTRRSKQTDEQIAALSEKLNALIDAVTRSIIGGGGQQ